MGRFNLTGASLLSACQHLLCLQPSPDLLSSESAPPRHSGEEGGDPPPPRPGLALVCHLHGLAALTLDVSSYTTTSSTSGTGDTPPTSCDDLDLVDSLT